MAAEEFLASNRSELGTEITSVLAQRLDELDSGIEIVALTIEALHPPLPTADAFDKVQTAHEEVATLRASANGRGDARVITAGGEAQAMLAAARAEAVEKLAAARTQQNRFTTDSLAAAAGGEAFRLERFLAAWQAGVGDRPLTVIDPTALSDSATGTAQPFMLPLTFSDKTSAP